MRFLQIKTFWKWPIHCIIFSIWVLKVTFQMWKRDDGDICRNLFTINIQKYKNTT